MEHGAWKSARLKRDVGWVDGHHAKHGRRDPPNHGANPGGSRKTRPTLRLTRMEAMMRLGFLSLMGLLLLSSSALSQALPTPAERLDNSRRHHEWVDIESPGGRKVHTFVAYPESDKPATVVIVIHENR